MGRVEQAPSHATTPNSLLGASAINCCYPALISF